MTQEEMTDILMKEIVKIERLKLQFVKEQDFTIAAQLRETEKRLRAIVREIEIKKAG